MSLIETRVVSKGMMPEGVETTSVPPKLGDKVRVFKNLPGGINIQKRPSLIRKAGNFAKASAQHVAKGRPKASLEIIQQRFAICSSKEQKCDYFLQTENETGKCLHPKCGCRLSALPVGRNKLAWADQKCPIGKWTATDG